MAAHRYMRYAENAVDCCSRRMLPIGSASFRGLMLVAALFGGCVGLPFGYRCSLTHHSVEGNLAGPYMPTRAVSPTEIKATFMEGGVRKDVTLELRGVACPSDVEFRKDVTAWLHRKVAYFEDEGVYLLRDTLVDLGNDRLRGVVLYPLQRSVCHDVTSGRTVSLVSLYGVLQCDALELGQLLHQKDDAVFSWDRDFARFQQEARRDRLGYWGKQESK